MVKAFILYILIFIFLPMLSQAESVKERLKKARMEEVGVVRSQGEGSAQERLQRAQEAESKVSTLLASEGKGSDEGTSEGQKVKSEEVKKNLDAIYQSFPQKPTDDQMLEKIRAGEYSEEIKNAMIQAYQQPVKQEASKDLEPADEPEAEKSKKFKKSKKVFKPKVVSMGDSKKSDVQASDLNPYKKLKPLKPKVYDKTLKRSY